MLDYAEMYLTLFRAMKQAIDILQKAQQATEEMYISGGNTTIAEVPKSISKENKDGDHS